MPWNRRTRLITALFALLSLLFMQLAVASYACPGTGTTAGEVAHVAVMAEVGAHCEESMALDLDDVQPSLCHAHCQPGEQSAAKYELPSPVAIGALPVRFALPMIVPVFSGTSLQAPHLKHTTAPPVAIRHCCFRL